MCAFIHVLIFVIVSKCRKIPKLTNIVIKDIIHVGEDHAALFTAIRLGYQNIIYTGTSCEAKKFLSIHQGDQHSLETNLLP
jgi:hypothetical protein